MASPTGNFLDATFAWIDHATVHFVEHVYKGMVADNWPLIVTIFSLYFIVFGWMIWLRLVEVDAQTFYRKGLLIIFIGMLVSSYGFFEAAIYQIFVGGPDQFVSGMLNVVRINFLETSGITTGIQLFVDKAVVLGSKVWDFGGMGYIWGIAILASVGYLLYKAIGILIMARVFSAALLAIAPLFFISYLFKPTRGLFFGWLQSLIGLFLGQVLVYAVLALILAILQFPILDLERNIATNDMRFSQFFTFCLLICSLAYLFNNVQGTAASIANGFVMQQYDAAKDGMSQHAGKPKEIFNNLRDRIRRGRAI